jgi:hypothetical protein
MPSRKRTADDAFNPSTLPDPQPVADDNDNCPIDWTLPSLSKVTPIEKDVYELRTPWKTKAKTSYPDIDKRLGPTYYPDNKPSMETWRRKFESANYKVFKATRQWWALHVAGIKDLVQDATAKVPKNDATLAKRREEREKARRLRGPKGDVLRIYTPDEAFTDDNGVEQSDVPEDHSNKRTSEVADRVRTLHYSLIQKDLYRDVDAKAARGICKAFAKAVDGGHEFVKLPVNVDPRILDILLSCFTPVPEKSIPRLGRCLIRNDTGRWAYIEFVLDVTLHESFELYLLAKDLEIPEVCDIVMNAWRDTFRREIQLREEYNTGKRPWKDLPSGWYPNILDFEPKDLNALWNTKLRGTGKARGLWLDILRFKDYLGYEKIRGKLGEYCTEFVEQWVTQLPAVRLREISKMVAQHCLEEYTPPSALSRDVDMGEDVVDDVVRSLRAIRKEYESRLALEHAVRKHARLSKTVREHPISSGVNGDLGKLQRLAGRVDKRKRYRSAVLWQLTPSDWKLKETVVPKIIPLAPLLSVLDNALSRTKDTPLVTEVYDLINGTDEAFCEFFHGHHRFARPCWVNAEPDSAAQRGKKSRGKPREEEHVDESEDDPEGGDDVEDEVEEDESEDEEIEEEAETEDEAEEGL